MEIIGFLLCVYALWPLYVFTMAMLRAKIDGTTTLIAWILAFPVIIAALILDVILNFTIFALIMLEMPYKKGEWTFSQRLSRLSKGTGWRASFSKWIAKSLLDPYDPSGKHI